uniref:Uncharacterized protein n=1 Tax=Nelumbo nucifera TaxID=4432 RepID=A0A822YE50_NELNU|nr:TPA_asm: hypothetical protein HUJ06_031249 [Nelumbo nucifera]
MKQGIEAAFRKKKTNKYQVLGPKKISLLLKRLHRPPWFHQSHQKIQTIASKIIVHANSNM